MKHKVSELEGALLDVAVAKAEGFADPHAAYVQGEDGALRPFEPSDTWKDGGPIIEREEISVMVRDLPDKWSAVKWLGSGERLLPVQGLGPTPLIAAMRAYIASRFGEFVEL